jgi:uncharacterized membrane protein
MRYEWALFLHLAAAFAFVGGSVTAAVLRLAAMRPARPSEVALLLRAVRPVVPLVAGGLVLTVVFGFWLADIVDADFGATWLTVTFVLVAWMLVVGTITGRQDRHTRELAERLAAESDNPSDELAHRLRDPINLTLSLTLLLAALAVIALMVWRPGA